MTTKRVHFEDEENLGIFRFPSDSIEIKEFIQCIFDDKERNMGHYELLLQTINTSDNDEILYHIISALSKRCTDLNDRKYFELIKAMLGLKWLNKNDKFIKTYSHLLLNLVSCQCQFISNITSMLVDNLRTGPERYSSVQSSFIFDQTHSVLIKVLNLIPLGPSYILSILSKKMPHKTDSNLQFFCSSLLHISEYLPSIRTEIFGLILELLVEIDADIPFDQLDDLVFEDDEEDEDGMFEMEMEETLKDSFSAGDEDPESISSTSDNDSDSDGVMLITSDSKALIQKLDTLMCIVMEYLSDLYKKSVASGDFENLSEVFDGLLQGFNRIILPTHRIRSTQFIIFYSCSLVPEVFCQDFLGLLISHLITTSHSSVSRISSASYLGSFIARAKFIDLPSVRHCLLLLNQQCLAYLDSHESSIRGQLEIERYGVLYASVQAILYIFCFRWRQVMIINDKPISGSFPIELKDFQRVLLSKFCPLRVCSEVIVQEFAKITHQLNIIYCYSLMSSSSRSTSALVSHGTHGGQIQIPRIETYFPFDPLALNKSKKYVASAFQEWGDDEDAEDTLTDPADSDVEVKGMSLDESIISMSMSLSLH